MGRRNLASDTEGLNDSIDFTVAPALSQLKAEERRLFAGSYWKDDAVSTTSDAGMAPVWIFTSAKRSSQTTVSSQQSIEYHLRPARSNL